jgi:FeS assembly protein IscX
MIKRTWRDVDDIAIDLVEKFPSTDPMLVKLPELKQMVTDLATFGDNPDEVTDRMLEAIQAAWYDEFED